MSKREIEIKIDAEFGSEYQEDIAYDLLTNLIKAWECFLLEQHKKNKLTACITKK